MVLKQLIYRGCSYSFKNTVCLCKLMLNKCGPKALAACSCVWRFRLDVLVLEGKQMPFLSLCPPTLYHLPR